MAQVDGELKIAARIDTSSVRQDSNKLAKTIQSVFSSYARDTKKASSSLLSLQNQMKKYVDELERARAEQKKIGETKIYSDEYKRMQSDLDKTRDRASKLKTEMDSLNAKRANLGKQTIMTNDYAKISNEYNKLGNQIDKLGDKQRALANLQKQASTDKEVAEIQKKIDGLETQINTTKELRNIQKSQMEEMKKEGNAFTTMQQAYRTGIGQTTSEYNNLIDKIRQVKSEYRSATSKASFLSKNISSPEFQRANITSGVDTEQYAKAGEKVTNLENKLAQLAARYNDVNGASKKSGNTLKTAFGKAKDMVKGVNSKLKELKTKSSNTFSDMAKNAKTSFWKILKYAFGIRSLFVLFKRLKKYIKEAFGAMSESVPQVKQEIDTLKVNFTQLRNSLATAFQPIFSYIVPALNALCNALISAMNVLANFFATLTGQKFIYKATKANDALADSIGGAGKAAKDANEDIAEYDKLIVINKNNDPNSGGGGGGNANANAGAFEKVPSEVNKLAELIKQGWKESDFTKVGAYIGNSLKSALNKIPWAELQKKASKLGKVFSTLINGFVEVPDLGNTIGRTIAQGLNTAFTAVNTFVHNLHWDSVGKFIGDTLTSGLLTFDWDKAVDTITTGLGGIATAVTNFFTTVQRSLPQIMSKVNKAVQDFINNFPVDKISTAIGTTVNTVLAVVNGLLPNLSDLVRRAGELIMETVKKINWKEVGKLLSNAFRELIQSITALLETLDWEAIGKAIGDFLAGIDWAGIANDLWELLKTALKSAWNLLIKGIPELFKKAPVETAIIGVFALMKFTGLGSLIVGKLKSVIINGIVSGSLGTAIGNALGGLFRVGGPILAIVGTAIAGWKIGETFIAPAVEKGLTYISQKYGPLARLEEQNLMEERKQKIAEVGISINGVRQEMKKYGMDSKEATAIAKKGYEDIAKQIDTTYAAESKWRAELDKLNAKRRLNLISEKDRLKELQKIYDETTSKMTKITAGISLFTSKVNEEINGTSEELKETTKNLGTTAQETAKHYEEMYNTSTKAVKETTKDLGKEAQATAKHYEDLYGKSISKPAKKATKDIKKVGTTTKKTTSFLSKTIKNTSKSWKAFDKEIEKSNKNTEKSTTTLTGNISKSFEGMRDKIVKSSLVASTKTVTNLNNIKKKTSVTGLAEKFRTEIEQMPIDADEKAKLTAKYLNAIGSNIDFQSIVDKATGEEDGAFGKIVKGASASVEALDKIFSQVKGVQIDTESPKQQFEQLIKNIQSVNTKDASSGFAKIAETIEKAFSDTKDNLCGENGIFHQITMSAQQFILGAGGTSSTGVVGKFTSAVKNIIDAFTKDDPGFIAKIKGAFEELNKHAQTYAIGNDASKPMGIWGKFHSAAEKIVDKFTTKSKFSDKIKNVFSSLNDYAQTYAVGKDSNNPKGIWGKFKKAAENSASAFTSTKSEGFKNKIKGAFEELNKSAESNAGSTGTFFGNAAQSIKDAFSGTKDSVTGSFSSMADSANTNAGIIGNAFTSASNSINTLLTKIANAISTAFSTLGGATSGNRNNKYNNPHLAKGGVIPPNHEFLAVLGDQKQGYNIETPLDTMVEAFNTALKQSGGYSSNKEPIVLQLDGKTVAKVVWDENQKRYKQTGNAKFA